MRTSDGMLTTDLETEEPVVLQNILIVEAEHQVKDTDGRRDIDLRSGGQGLLLQNGEVRQVDWKNEDGRIIPVKDGKTVPLFREKRGSTSFPISARFLLVKEKVCNDADR